MDLSHVLESWAWAGAMEWSLGEEFGVEYIQLLLPSWRKGVDSDSPVPCQCLIL